MEYFVFYLLGFVLNMFIIHIINLREIDDVDIKTAFVISLFSWLGVLFSWFFLLDHYGFFKKIDNKFRGIK